MNCTDVVDVKTIQVVCSNVDQGLEWRKMSEVAVANLRAVDVQRIQSRKILEMPETRAGNICSAKPE